MSAPIHFSYNGDQITIAMDRDDWNRLLLILGFAIGAALKEGNTDWARLWLDFVNRLNRENPDFIPYEVPE